MALLIALLIGLLLFGGVYLLLRRRTASEDNIRVRVQRLHTSSAPVDQARYEADELDKPLLTRLFAPVYEYFAKRVIAATPSELYKLAVNKVTMAGDFYKGTTRKFIVTWAAMAVLMPLLTIVYTSMLLHMAFIQAVLLTLFAFFAGAMLPIVHINSLIKKRQAAIMRQLPEMMDLVCISVQAGLSFDGAVAKVIEKMKGPLIDECRRFLQDTRIGITRREALNRMAERCQLQEIYLFTAAIIQCDRLGTGMADTLLMQADNMRERHRQRIKKLALTAPLKIIFPLVIFIFPTLFIIALAPALISLMNNMSLGR